MTQTTSLMTGKKGLIMGVANDQSIAWGIAKACAAQGADLAFTYQGERTKTYVEPLLKDIGAKLLLPCDVTDSASMDNVFGTLKAEWGELDFIVHAIAFTQKEALAGKYYDVTADNFAKTMHISVFSFTDICKRAQSLMTTGGSLLTLSYLGAERYIPNYNVMGVAKAALDASVKYLAVDLGERGIRVNSLSAGPIQTRAASAIAGFHTLLKWNEINAPLQRNVTIDDVGGAGLYLLSDLAAGVTGEVHHVDGGYNAQGMPHPTKTAEHNADLLSQLSNT